MTKVIQPPKSPFKPLIGPYCLQLLALLVVLIIKEHFFRHPPNSKTGFADRRNDHAISVQLYKLYKLAAKAS